MHGFECKSGAAGRQEGRARPKSCLPWDRFPLWMGWVCGPPFQRDEIGSLGSQEEARVLGLQVVDLVLCSLLVWQGCWPWPQAVGRRSCSLPHCCSTAQQPAGPWSAHRSQVSIRSWSAPAWRCLLWLCRGRQGQQPLGEESTWHLSCSSAACDSTAARCHLLLGLPGEEMCFHPDAPGARAPQLRLNAHRQLQSPGGKDGQWCFASAMQWLLWSWAVPVQQVPPLCVTPIGKREAA